MRPLGGFSAFMASLAIFKWCVTLIFSKPTLSNSSHFFLSVVLSSLSASERSVVSVSDSELPGSNSSASLAVIVPFFAVGVGFGGGVLWVEVVCSSGVGSSWLCAV